MLCVFLTHISAVCGAVAVRLRLGGHVRNATQAKLRVGGANQIRIRRQEKTNGRSQSTFLGSAAAHIGTIANGGCVTSCFGTTIVDHDTFVGDFIYLLGGLGRKGDGGGCTRKKVRFVRI